MKDSPSKMELYDTIAQKVTYIQSIASLVCAANNADSVADIDAVGLCSDLAEDIMGAVEKMVRTKS